MVLALIITLLLVSCHSLEADNPNDPRNNKGTVSSSSSEELSSSSYEEERSSSSSENASSSSYFSSSSVEDCLAPNNSEQFCDNRDNKIYKFIKIGSQTWMAENLNYNADGSKCYENKEDNCDTYGRLYNWETAMLECPSGWHLPANEEWDLLYRFADSSNGTESPYKSETAGKYLKATSSWDDYEEYGNGTDNHGFAALAGGFDFLGYYFINIGINGFWWTASESKEDYNAYSRYMDFISDRAEWIESDKDNLFSIRCIKDN